MYTVLPELFFTEEPGFRSLGFDGKELFPSKNINGMILSCFCRISCLFLIDSRFYSSHIPGTTRILSLALSHVSFWRILKRLPPESVGFSFADVRIMSEDYSDDETLELQEEENAADNQRWPGSNSSERIRRSR